MRNVLVTGASGGIGSAIARAFAERGDSVALGYNKNEERINELLAEMNQNGRVVAVQADLTREAEVERMFAEAEREQGEIDVLVNCAGISHMAMLTDMTLGEWNNVMSTNLTSAFLCCKRALPAMVRKKTGCIINIGSIWGEVGASCEAAYSASKAGILGLSKALAKECGPSGIRINCISPGLIKTEMNAALSDEDIRAFCADVPLGRQGLPEEIAAAVVFLPDSEYITGQVISVNGGIF